MKLFGEPGSMDRFFRGQVAAMVASLAVAMALVWSVTGCGGATADLPTEPAPTAKAKRHSWAFKPVGGGAWITIRASNGFYKTHAWVYQDSILEVGTLDDSTRVIFRSERQHCRIHWIRNGSDFAVIDSTIGAIRMDSASIKTEEARSL